MADIHIGKIKLTGPGKGKAQLYYHIPIDSPVPGVIPTSESAIAAQLQQSEIDALACGSLIEMSRTIVVIASQTQEEIATTIKTDWQNAKTIFNDMYNFKYKFYGVTLNATA